MKRYITKLITISTLIVLLFSSCREEVTIDIPGTNEPAIKANTTLAGLMQRTSLKDGSKDNIIDHANCFSIKLPVTVIANGQEITVNTEDAPIIVSSALADFIGFKDPATVETATHITVCKAQTTQAE